MWLSSIQIYSFKVFTHLLLVFSGWPRAIWWTGTGRLPWFTCKFFPCFFFFFSNYGGASFVLLQFLVSVASNWAGSDILLRSEARCNIYYPLQYALSVQMPDPSLTQWFPHFFIYLFIYFFVAAASKGVAAIPVPCVPSRIPVKCAGKHATDITALVHDGSAMLLAYVTYET